MLLPLLFLQTNAAVVDVLESVVELKESNTADGPGSAADAAAAASAPAPQARDFPVSAVSGEDAKQTRGCPRHIQPR